MSPLSRALRGAPSLPRALRHPLPRALLCALSLFACRASLPAPEEPWVTTPNEPFRHEPPPLDPLPALALPEVSTATLPSGLRSIVIHQPAPLTAIHYVSGRGGVRETPGAPDANMVTLDALLDYGALGVLDTHGAVDPGSVRLAVQVFPDEVRPTLDHLAAFVARPTFDHDRLATSLRRAAKRRTNEINHPGHEARYQSLSWLLGDDDALSQPANRRVALLKTFDAERAEVAHLRMFAPEAGTVVVVGPVDPAQTQAFIATAFGEWPASGRPPPPSPATATATTPEDIHYLRTPNYRTAVLMQAIPEPAITAPDYVAHRLFTLLFARMFTSRLNLAVRERAGHSYGAVTEQLSWPGGGALVVGAIVDEEALGTVCRAFLEEAHQMATTAPSNEDLITAKGQFRSALRARVESPAALAHVVAELATQGLPLSHLTALDRTAALTTAEDVHAAASTYLARASPLVVSGRPDVALSQLEDLDARILYEEPND